MTLMSEDRFGPLLEELERNLPSGGWNAAGVNPKSECREFEDLVADGVLSRWLARKVS